MGKSVQEIFTRKQIANIAVAYAQGNYTHFNFLQQYGYESHVFYKILHLAVDKRIVSEAVAKQIQKTAVANSSQKAKENRFDREYISRIESRVFNSWQRRIEAARNFKFSKKESKSLVTSYSKNSLPFNEFCRKNCIDKNLFWNTVIDAIIYTLVDDECFDRIYEKELSNGNAEKVEHLFYQLTKRRKEKKALK